MKLHLEGDQNIYLPFKEAIEKSNVEVVGHLIMDEITLKIGIAYNISSGEVIGFVIEQFDTSKLLESILHPKTSTNNESQLILYANQW